MEWILTIVYHFACIQALQSGSQNIRDSNRTLHEAKQLAIEEREIRQSEVFVTVMDDDDDDDDDDKVISYGG